MKKPSTFILALLLALGLAACGGTAQPGGNGNDPPVNGRPQNIANNHSFTYNGTAIAMGAEPDPVLAALGEPLHKHEDPNCAIEGGDVQYTYPGILLTCTYPPPDAGDPPFIASLRLRDDSVATPEGVTIGSDASEVTRAYGTADREINGFHYFVKGQSELSISVDSDGEVNQIIYQYLFLD